MKILPLLGGNECLAIPVVPRWNDASSLDLSGNSGICTDPELDTRENDRFGAVMGLFRFEAHVKIGFLHRMLAQSHTETKNVNKQRQKSYRLICVHANNGQHTAHKYIETKSKMLCVEQTKQDKIKCLLVTHNIYTQHQYITSNTTS